MPALYAPSLWQTVRKTGQIPKGRRGNELTRINRSAQHPVRNKGTPRAPDRACLPLLPSGPGGFSEMTPHEGSFESVRGYRCKRHVGCSVASPAEDSPSGLWRSLGKRVGRNPSGVQIPYPPLRTQKGPAHAGPFCRSSNLLRGGVSERPKEHASKACVGATPPWVQIPPPPPVPVARSSRRSRGPLVAKPPCGCTTRCSSRGFSHLRGPIRAFSFSRVMTTFVEPSATND